MKSVLAFFIPVLLFQAVLIFADSESIDFATISFLPENHVSVCSSSDDSERILEESTPGLFGDEGDDEYFDALVDPSAVFAEAAEKEALIEEVEANLENGISSDSTEHDLDDVVPFIERVSKELFSGGMIDSLKRVGSNVKNSVDGYLGFGKISLCTAGQIYKNLEDPENIATTLCKCMTKAQTHGAQCRIVSALFSSKSRD